MQVLKTQVVKVNGQFDVYASENTKRFQQYADLATEMGRNWNEMTKRARANFRKNHADKIKEIPTKIEVFEVTATIPLIFGEYQLKEAAIHHLIFPNSGTLFLECKNGKTGYSTSNFKIGQLK